MSAWPPAWQGSGAIGSVFERSRVDGRAPDSRIFCERTISPRPALCTLVAACTSAAKSAGLSAAKKAAEKRRFGETTTCESSVGSLRDSIGSSGGGAQQESIAPMARGASAFAVAVPRRGVAIRRSLL